MSRFMVVTLCLHVLRGVKGVTFLATFWYRCPLPRINFDVGKIFRTGAIIVYVPSDAVKLGIIAAPAISYYF